MSLLIAAGLVFLAFPEVVVGGGSLSPLGLSRVVNLAADRDPVNIYANIDNRQPADGVRDVGARAWQLVPATKFMHRAIYDGESPSWNPYSAAGSLGPETLADMKLSPFVLAVAVLGASDAAFTFVTLAFAVLALFCMQEFFTRTLGTGRLAATAACVVFLLNGFATSEITSQVGAPYVLFPVVLYALAEFHRVGGPLRFLVAMGAYGALILTTFVAVALLMLLLVHAVVLFLDVSGWRGAQAERVSFRRIAGLVFRHAAVPIAALLATAFMWLPVLEAVRNAGNDLSKYSQPRLGTRGRLEILNVLTPRVLREGDFVVGLGRTGWILYLGVAPLMLIAAALPRANRFERRFLVLTGGLGLVALSMHLGVPLLKAVGELPGPRLIGAGYWASLSAAAVALVVGVSTAIAVSRGLSARGSLAGSAVFAVWLLAAWVRSSEMRSFSVPSLLAALVVVFVVLASALAASRQSARRSLFATFIIGVLAIELLSYQNHVRVRRFDIEDQLPEYVAFLREHLGDGRILNAGGTAIYPEWGAALAIPQLETLNLMQLEHYREFYRRYVLDPGDWQFLAGNRNVPFRANAAAISLLSVRYILVDSTMPVYERGVQRSYPLVFDDRTARVRVYENPNAFPRAYLSPALSQDRFRRGSPEQLQARASTGWPKVQTISDDPDLLHAARRAGVPSQASSVPPDEGTARITRSRNTEVEVEVDTPRAAVLVLTDSYHSNWDVSVDGNEAELGRVNDVVRGVVVPAGRSTVAFRYESSLRTLGLAVSATTVLLVVLATSAWAWRRSRPGKLDAAT